MHFTQKFHKISTLQGGMGDWGFAAQNLCSAAEFHQQSEQTGEDLGKIGFRNDLFGYK